MNQQDTVYFELRDALLEGGCPLCRLGSRAATRYIDTLNYEGVNDPGLRRVLRNAHGLCHDHAWEWTHLRGAPLGVAIVYQNLVKDLIAAMEQAQTGPARGRRQAPTARLTSATRCPACHAQDEAVKRYAQTLLAYLDTPEVAAGYAQAGGLCLPHLRSVLVQAGDAQAHTLKAWQLAIYRNLNEELAEFIRKHDHRFSHEPFGAEKDAWLRTVAVFTGEASREP